MKPHEAHLWLTAHMARLMRCPIGVTILDWYLIISTLAQRHPPLEQITPVVGDSEKSQAHFDGWVGLIGDCLICKTWRTQSGGVPDIMLMTMIDDDHADAN